VKELLINEYHEAIGYRSRSEMNKSEWVFDVRGGGDYIVAAMSSLSISNEQLLQNMASRLSEKNIGTSSIAWPTQVDNLEQEEELSELLVKLLTWLKQPKRKTVDHSPSTLSLASMITYYM